MRTVQSVSYRHVAAYLRVVGRTRPGAERHTKSVGTALRETLPEGAQIKPGRYKGIQNGLHVFEVPVLLNRPKVKKVLAELVLRGNP
jgi:hypothetical protein